MREELAKVKKRQYETKTGLYCSSCSKGPVTMLRKITAKVRKHRCTWEADSCEGEQYRLTHAELGGTYFSTMRARTTPWVPRGPRDTPLESVTMMSADIAYFFFQRLAR